MRVTAPLICLSLAVTALGQDRENCLYCHQFPGLSRFDVDTQRVRLFYVDPSYIHAMRGPHARLACGDCHTPAAFSVIPHTAAARVDCTQQCHIVSSNALPRRFSHEDVARRLEQSSHAFEKLAQLEFSGGRLLEPGQSQCLYCHDEPLFRRHAAASGLRNLSTASTDRCDTCHSTQIPVDTSFALAHVASRLEPARPTLEVAQVCAVCHSDPKVLAGSNLHDAVASYVRSFHAKAALLGDQTTASCLQCHVASGQTAHDMLGKADPQSAVHPQRVAESCRSTACHPGADPALARNAVHLDLPTARETIEFAVAVAFIILTIVSFGPSALIVILELLQLVVGRHAHAATHVRHAAEKILARPDGRKQLARFSVKQRLQHWALTLLFILLVLTGFPMKFADHAWASVTIQAFGGLQTARVIHHWAGIALVIGFAVHLADIVRGLGKRAAARDEAGRPTGWLRAFMELPIVLNAQDARRAGQLLAYLVGLRRDRPLFGRFSVTEKFEYFGVLWGTTLLGVTGLALWGEQISSHLLSGRMLNLATIAHTYEAFLALIHVGILHIYNVLLAPAVFPLSKATLTGETPLPKLCEENGAFVIETARRLGISVEPPNA